MSTHIVRRLKELKPVLHDPVSSICIDPDYPLYEVYRNMCGKDEREILLRHGLRYDVTTIPPLVPEREYVKAIGHGLIGNERMMLSRT